MHPVQVWLNEQVTNQNVDRAFSLPEEPLGNKIQLQSFDGCDSVETDSPIEHHPGRTGEKMLTLRGEHFHFCAKHAVILKFMGRVRDICGASTGRHARSQFGKSTSRGT